jgi:hypothetical protein
VREGVLPDDGLIVLDGETRDAADHRRGAGEVARVDACLVGQGIAAHFHGHHDFLQRGIARPLAETVDRALDLAGAVGDAGQRICDREAEVVMAVRGPDHLVRVRNGFDQPSDQCAVFFRVRVADRVRHVDRGRA